MTALAKHNGNTALAPQTFGESRLEGEDADDVILPRCHIYQGLPKEKELYGKHEEGDFVDTLSLEKIRSNKFVPILGYVQYAKFVKNSPRPEYSTRNKNEVPPEDLEWIGENAPAATKIINWIVLFEGHQFPHILAFKSTSIKAGQIINSLEKIRGKRGPGLYEILLTKRSNDNGTWLAPQVRASGDPTPEMSNLAVELFAGFKGVEIKTNEEADSDTGMDPDAQ